MSNSLKHSAVAIGLVLVLSVVASVAAAAKTPTPASGWITAMPCPRPPRTTNVSTWIETPGPVGTPVIPQTGRAASGAWQPPTVDLKDLPSGPDASAVTKAAIEQVLVDVSQCAAFPDDGVDAYFSDDFFRRTFVVEHQPATPGSGETTSGGSWGFSGIGDSSETPSVARAWELPGDRVGAVVQTGADHPRLFTVFVQDPKTGNWLIDEMAYLSGAIATPAS